jgi:hypothetical protein
VSSRALTTPQLLKPRAAAATNAATVILRRALVNWGQSPTRAALLSDLRRCNGTVRYASLRCGCVVGAGLKRARPTRWHQPSDVSHVSSGLPPACRIAGLRRGCVKSHVQACASWQTTEPAGADRATSCGQPAQPARVRSQRSLSTVGPTAARRPRGRLLDIVNFLGGEGDMNCSPISREHSVNTGPGRGLPADARGTVRLAMKQAF